MDDSRRALWEEIRKGQCIAFVGAGLVTPRVPGWVDLLRALVANVADEGVRSALAERLVAGPGPLELEAIAQIVRNALGEGFDAALAAALQGEAGADERVSRRIRWLGRLPLKGIVTTNFDDLLRGTKAGSAEFVELLTGAHDAWRRSGATPGAGTIADRRILKLHGQIGAPDNPVVLAREQYRDRVHRSGNYAAFLKALLATHPVLFLGTSFTDAYLNELRSEVLAWFPREGDAFLGKPRWWATLPDASSPMIEFFRRHEGIDVIPYASAGGHQAFDDFLEEAAERTGVEAMLKERLGARGARILWSDPDPGNNVFGREVFEDCVRTATTEAEAIGALGRAAAEGRPFDLVISHHGYAGGAPSAAERLLGALRERGLAVPVVVFASGVEADTNRRRLRGAGALDYIGAWQDLFRFVAEFFETEAERRQRLGY